MPKGRIDFVWFYEQHGKLPINSEDKDIFERLNAVRLNKICATEEESLAMAVLPTDDERQKLLSTFSSAQTAMQELMPQAAEDEETKELTTPEQMT